MTKPPRSLFEGCPPSQWSAISRAYYQGFADAERDTYQAIVRLSPWTNHHACCARVTQAKECDCGLQDELTQHRWSI